MVIVGIIWFFQVQKIESDYIESRESFLLDQTKAISELLLDEDSLERIPEEVRIRIEFLHTQENAQVYILDSDDKFINPRIYRTSGKIQPLLLVGSIKDRQHMSNLKERILSRSKTSPTIGEYSSKPPEPRVLVATYPMILDDLYLGKVIAVSPTMPIDNATVILQNQLTTITAILLCIGSLLALLLSSLITKPIHKMKIATKQIGKGHYDIRIPVTSTDELGQLSRDIEWMADQLKDKDQLTKEFVSSVSHDLKTPITLIQTYAEFMTETSDNLDQSELDYLKIIQDESIRLDNIVDDLLYLSRIDSGALNLKRDWIDVKELIEISLRSLNHTLEDLGIEVIVTEVGVTFPIYVDVNQMRRVMINLIQNALHHAGDLHEVQVRINYMEKHFRIEVIDLGVGIPEESLNRVWDRFYRVDQARQSKCVSAGIGMSIVKSILDKHDFNYGIESKINVGTTVWFEGSH